MILIASLLAAVLPMFTYLLIIWYFDLFEREPLKLVVQNYFWGAFGAVAFTLIGGFIIRELMQYFAVSADDIDFLGTIAIAPLIEEITKGFFLFLTVNKKRFDNITDGVVYGGAIGLGFGMTENFLYFTTYSENIPGWIYLVIIRTFFSAVMHFIATGSLGAFMGFAKFKKPFAKTLLILSGLIIAVLIHFIWNYTIITRHLAPLGFIFLGISIILFCAIFISSVIGERKIIFTELLDESRLGIIPPDHAGIISSLNRNKKGWINESIRKRYIKAATNLAFRKYQTKYLQGKRKILYQKDLEENRKSIFNLLSPAVNPDA
jgi:RsiW-degrading membrane proteinase PrsW (M82 family)